MCSDKVFVERASILEGLGVECLVDYGVKRVGRYSVVGKGWASIVVLCIQDGSLRVLKIRRLDSRRDSLEYEGMLLEYLAPYRLVPRVYHWSRDFIIMDYASSGCLRDYINMLLETGDTRCLRNLIASILVKAYILDKLGIDHGELNRPETHIVIDNGDPLFIDFESARYGRRVHNVTSLSSYFFIRSRFKEKLLGREVSRGEIVSRLQLYKKTLSLESLRLLLELLYN